MSKGKSPTPSTAYSKRSTLIELTPFLSAHHRRATEATASSRRSRLARCLNRKDPRRRLALGRPDLQVSIGGDGRLPRRPCASEPWCGQGVDPGEGRRPYRRVRWPPPHPRGR